MDWPSLPVLRLTMCARWIGFALFALTLLSNLAHAEEPFPYVAYVSQEDAYVRSGPGRRYYPTGQVTQGYAVEVYRHDDSGWCAVRPTEDSFSWVSAHQVRWADDQVVEVTAEQAVARVGSTLSPVRSAVQVMLPRGERARVLPSGPEDDPRWLRIVAPAGEFRWVAAQHLSRRPPVEVSPPASPGLGWGAGNGNPLAAPVASLAPTDFSHLLPAENATPGQSVGTLGHTAAAAPDYQLNVEVVAGSPAEAQLAQYQSQNQSLSPPQLLGQAPPVDDNLPVTETTAPRVRFPDLTASLAAKSEDVATLELLLSQMVSQPPGPWQLQPLEAEASDLLTKTSSSAERVQLRDLLGRIARFEQVQHEYESPVANPLSRPAFESPDSDSAEPEDEVSRVVGSVRDRVKQDLRATSPPATRRANSTAGGSKPLYDAVGKLKPVVSKREQAPPYALVNDKGEVVSFVTPAPDLNLQPYVGRRIGIHGNRGFIPEYHKAHVTAGRVSPIDGQLRR